MNRTILATVLLSASTLAACDDTSNAVKETLPDAGERLPGTTPGSSGNAGTDGGTDDCMRDPQTHDEIINACTTAVRIQKDPVLPKLFADGGLPPLQ